jgi:hypothetical protein
MLFSPGGSCVAPQLQLWLISSYTSKMRQFSFEYCPQSCDTSSVIHHGLTLGGWLVTPPLLSAFVTFPVFIHWEFDSLPTSILWGGFSILPYSHCQYWLQFGLYAFQFCWWGFNLPWSCTGLSFWVVGRTIACGVYCSPIGSTGWCRQF